MEDFAVVFLAVMVAILTIGVYCGLCAIVANCIKRPFGTRKAFWWVFFFGPVFGSIIYILLSMRDGN